MMCLDHDRSSERGRRLRQRPEDALSGRLLRAVLESAQEAVSLCADSERRVLTWNAAAERLFGYRVHEIVGRSIDILVPPAT